MSQPGAPSSNYFKLLMVVIIGAAIGLIVSVSVLVVQLVGETPTRGPRLAVDRERLDLGTLTYNQPARAVFTLTNTGDQPLQIARRQIQTKLIEGC